MTRDEVTFGYIGKRWEKFRAHRYKDPPGNDFEQYAIGWGHLLGPHDRRLTMDVDTANRYLKHDVLKAVDGLRRVFRKHDLHGDCNPEHLMLDWDQDNLSPRQCAFISMAYQLGEHGLEGFHDMWRAIRVTDWNLAAAAALDSKWAKHDTPSRAQEEAKMIATNKLPEDFNA